MPTGLFLPALFRPWAGSIQPLGHIQTVEPVDPAHGGRRFACAHAHAGAGQ